MSYNIVRGWELSFHHSLVANCTLACLHGQTEMASVVVMDRHSTNAITDIRRHLDELMASVTEHMLGIEQCETWVLRSS